MRSKKPAGAPWSPMRWAKRIAEAQPAADPPAGGDPPPADASGAPPPQTPPTPEQPAPAQAAPAASAQAEQPPGLSDEELTKLSEQQARTEIITVTGSLIGRKEVDSASPVSVLDKEKLESAGVTNLGDVLQKIPSQGNAINAQNNNGGDGSTRINLRSLGTNRTLVLLNGRRVVASGVGADDSVDFGTIPLAMIERVEVLKDGASAIYGSDAVAGVVNVITRTNMNGTEANVYTSTSQNQDGTNYDLSFVTGHSSNRGNVTFSGGYQQQKPVMAGERDFSKQTYTYNYCAPGDPECVERTLNGSPASATGRINTMPSSTLPTLNIPGCTSRYCTADGSGGFRNFISPTDTALGDNYNFQPLNYLQTPSNRINLFSNGHYDVTSNAHVFFEGQFNSRKSSQQLAEEPVDLAASKAPISANSVYNPLGQTVFDYRRRLVEFGPRSFDQDVNTARLVVGANGTTPEDLPVASSWKWEASYNYGRTDGTSTTHGSLIRSHLKNALGPSFVDPTAGPQCGAPGAVIDGCVPLSLLRPREVTPEMKKYLTFTGTTSGLNEQHSALLTTSGKLVDLPNNGDISVAIGGDYRFERGGFQPDPLTATGDTTGSAAEPTLGAYHAYEGFGELSIVPISGLDTLKWVELNAAGRAYSYNTFGSGITGKLSGLVRTAGGVAVRGTFGNAFRAPNIGELFAGQADVFPAIEDPCDTLPPGEDMPIPLDPTVMQQCAKQGVPANAAFSSIQQRTKVGGNPELKPETATVATAGIVYEPLNNLDFTLDYWNVNITNAITGLPVATILAQCYRGGVDKFCDQVQRDPVTHQIDHIIDLNQNVGSLATSGLDFSAAYQYQNRAGTFRHAVEGTYLFKFNIDTGTIDPETRKEQVLHGRGFFDLGNQPDLKLNILTTWVHPSGVSAGFNFRFIDSFQECQDNNCNDPTEPRRDVSKYAKGDIFVGYGLKTAQGLTRITAGVNNVTNATPPLIYNGGALNSDESAYDFMGRQFYVRLGQLF